MGNHDHLYVVDWILLGMRKYIKSVVVVYAWLTEREKTYISDNTQLIRQSQINIKKYVQAIYSNILQ